MHIIFEHVSFSYASKVSLFQPVLKDIDLEVDTKHIIGICGRTGSGKSTFIRHLNGILKPNAGKVLIDGEDIHRSKTILRHARQRIGMTFQFPERQLFGKTVWEELTYTLERRHLPAQEIEERIFSVTEGLHFDISTLRHRSPFSLSRGEQRKLGIAVILALQPELLILDEPTAGMDRAHAYQLLDLLKLLQRGNRIQLILVSHDFELLLKYATYLIIIHDGRIELSGKLRELINKSEQLNGLGMPLPPVYRTWQILRQKYPQFSDDMLSVRQVIEEVIRHIPL
jgi:energy-coupling factor transport system ATP-binding protein